MLRALRLLLRLVSQGLPLELLLELPGLDLRPPLGRRPLQPIEVFGAALVPELPGRVSLQQVPQVGDLELLHQGRPSQVRDLVQPPAAGCVSCAAIPRRLHVPHSPPLLYQRHTRPLRR